MRRLAIGLLCWLMLLSPGLAQDGDRGVLQRFLEDNLSDAGRDVRIAGFAGALSGRATLERLTIADEAGIWLTIEGAVFDWNRAALLRGALEVDELSAKTIILARVPQSDSSTPTPEATPFSLPDLPISIDLQRLAVERLDLGDALFGAAASLRLDGAVSLANREGQARLILDRIDGAEGRVQLEGSYSNASQRLALQLNVQEGADGIAATLLGLPERPAINLSIQGDDPITEFGAEIRLSTNGQARLQGRARLSEAEGLRRIEADLGGDLRPLVEESYRDFLGRAARLQAQATRLPDGRLEVETLTLRAAALDVQGSLALAADGWPDRVALSTEIAARDQGAVVLPLTGPETRVEGLSLTLDFDRAQSNRWALDADMTGLARDGLTLSQAQITGRGQLQPEAERLSGVLDLALAELDLGDAGLSTAIGPSLAGNVRFDWTQGAPLQLSEMRLSGADYALEGTAGIAGVDGQLDLGITLDAQLVAEDLSRFAAVSGQALAGRASLQIEGDFAPVSGAFDLSLEGATEDLTLGLNAVDALVQGETDLRLSAVRDETGVRLRMLRLRSEAARILAEGKVATGASDLALTAGVTDLSDVLAGADGPAQFDGRAQQTGDRWALRGDVTAPGETRGMIEAFVTLADGRAGPVEGTADLSIADVSPYSDLAGLALGGALSMQAKGRGDVGDQTFEATAQARGNTLRIGQSEVDALLRGQTDLEVEVSQAADQVLRLRRLDLRNSALRAALSGNRSADQTDLRYDLALEDIARLLPDLSGPTTAKGTLMGRTTAGGMMWDIGADLTAPGAATGRVALRAETDGDSLGPLEGQAALKAQRLAAYAGLLGLPLRGALDLSVTGQGDGTAQRFAADIEARAQGLGIGQAEVDQLLRGETVLSGNLSGDATGLLQLDGVSLRTNEVSADVSGQLSTADTRLRYALRLRDLGLFVSGLSGALQADGTLAAADDGPLRLATALRGPGGTTADVTGQIARDGQRADLQATGALPLGLANRFISPNRLDGQARFDLRLNGPFGLPALSGSLRSTGGRMSLPDLRLALTEIATDLRIAGGAAQIDLQSRVSSGGRLSVSGQVALTPSYRADLTAALRGLTVTDPQLYETRLDGQIALRGPLQGGAAISGRLDVGPTEIRVPSGFSEAGGALPGLQHVGEPAAVRRTRARAGLIEDPSDQGAGPAFPLDLTINAPARIFVRGRGLDAEFGGALRLGGTTAAVAPQGRFDLIRGRLDILGKRLTLSEAFLQMQGDFDPFIRAVAATDADGVAIRIVVEGLASSPEVRFTSSPELPEEEVLARLLFGRDMTQISALQALQLANAIRVLAGKGGEGVLGRLRQTFGLDDLDVSTSESGETGLSFGKYVSDNVYTGVTVDSSGRSEINLNLSLSPSLTLRGSAGSDANTGIGIFFERDY